MATAGHAAADTFLVENSMNKFTRFYSDMMSQDSLNSLLITIAEAETELDSMTGHFTKSDARKFLENIFNATRQAKRKVATDLITMHQLLSSAMIAVESSDEDPHHLLKKVKVLNRWMVELQVQIDDRRLNGHLIDYFKNLEELKSEVDKINDSTEDIRQNYLKLAESERRLKRELEAERAKNERNEDKVAKAKETLADMKDKYEQLFRKHQQLLEKQTTMVPCVL